MNNYNVNRLDLLPVESEENRPLWSVMIPTYNCAHYLRETLKNLLAQASELELMQIEVIDDCSTKDDPSAIVAELGQGKVCFYRQPRNVGYIRNFETCLQRSRGHLIHILHGDDYVRDGFYQKMELAFVQKPEVGAAFCRSIYVDELGHWQSISPLENSTSGILSNWLPTIASGQRLTTPSIVVKREVYEQLGGFDRRFSCAGEDWEMWVRIATQYSVWFETEPLAAYRVKRLGSLTADSEASGKLVKDMCLATEIIASYLPQYLDSALANQIIDRAKNTYAQWGIDATRQMLIHGKIKDAIFQSQEVLRRCNSWQISYSLFVLWLQKFWRWIFSLPRKASKQIKAIGSENLNSNSVE